MSAPRDIAEYAPTPTQQGMILQAMAETGAHADRTVMIGDTTFDIDMARAAGVASVGVTWGYHPREQLVASGAGRIIDAFGELEGVLAEMLDLRSAAAQMDRV